MKYFGTDGIRGVAGPELSPSLAYKAARAISYELKGRADKIVIATDTRKSRDLLKSALIAGITSIGLDAIDLGIIPTPACAYFTRKLGAACGIVVSASHNPAKFNGIKVFAHDGFKFPDQVEEDFERLIDQGIDYYAEAGQVGSYKKYDKSVDEYIDFLKGTFPDLDLSSYKLVLDCARGATSEIGPRLFKELGAEVIAYNTDYNGLDINKDCGATNPGIITKLTLDNGADAGFSFDGDGDRLIVSDEKGHVMDGDHYLAAVADFMKEEKTLKKDTVVATVMANIGLKKFLKENGMTCKETKVGDRYVLDEMRKNGYNLGGEQSGHFLLLDLNTTGCGLLSALKLAEVVHKTGSKMSELNEKMTSYPQVLLNARVENDKKNTFKEDKKIMEGVKEAEDTLSGQGRVLIRPSGTEPYIRVMVEGEDEDELRHIAKRLVDLIEERLG